MYGVIEQTDDLSYKNIFTTYTKIYDFAIWLRKIMYK